MAKPKARNSRFRAGITFPGWVFVWAFILTAAAAVNTGFNLLYIVVGVVAAFLIVSYVMAVRSVRHLHAAAEAPVSAHRSIPFTVTLRIENRKWLMPALLVRVEQSGAARQARAFIASLPAGATASARISQTLERRGAHALPSYTLVSSAPFGLVEAWRAVPVEAEVLVYPRIRPLRTTAAEQTAGSRYRARASSGDGDEYFSIREYLPGDDIRKISWKASARTGHLMVRELSRENSRFVIFLLDTRMESLTLTPEADERFEEAVDLAASLAVTLLQRQYNVAIASPSGAVEGGEGSSQKRRIMEFLARAQPVLLDDFPNFDENHCGLETTLAAVLLVSPDPARWGRRNGSGGVRVLDPGEVVYG